MRLLIPSSIPVVSRPSNQFSTPSQCPLTVLAASIVGDSRLCVTQAVTDLGLVETLTMQVANLHLHVISYPHRYNETRIKMSLGAMSPMEYRRNLGWAV